MTYEIKYRVHKIVEDTIVNPGAEERRYVEAGNMEKAMQWTREQEAKFDSETKRGALVWFTQIREVRSA